MRVQDMALDHRVSMLHVSGINDRDNRLQADHLLASGVQQHGRESVKCDPRYKKSGQRTYML
jgi:hypothetical protein